MLNIFYLCISSPIFTHQEIRWLLLLLLNSPSKAQPILLNISIYINCKGTYIPHIYIYINSIIIYLFIFAIDGCGGGIEPSSAFISSVPKRRHYEHFPLTNLTNQKKNAYTYTIKRPKLCSEHIYINKYSYRFMCVCVALAI